MVRTIPLFILVAAMTVGCATVHAPPPATPAPAPAPAAPATRATPAPAPAPHPATPPTEAKPLKGIGFSILPGWVPRNLGQGVIMLMNRQEHAMILMMPLPLSQTTLQGAVEGQRRDIMKKGGVTPGRVMSSPAKHLVMWRYTRKMHGISWPVQGTVLAKRSNLDGYGLLVSGLWPTKEDNEMLSQFSMIAGSIRLKQ